MEPQVPLFSESWYSKGATCSSTAWAYLSWLSQAALPLSLNNNTIIVSSLWTFIWHKISQRCITALKDIPPALLDSSQMRQTHKVAWARAPSLVLYFIEHAEALNCSPLNSELQCQVWTEVHFRAWSGTPCLSVMNSCWHWILLKPNHVVKEKVCSG